MAMNDRIIGFDYLRILAAFSVVWIHGSDTNAVTSKISIINSYAVPAFIMISIYLLYYKLDLSNRVLITQIQKLFKRIGLSYFFWTIVYILVRMIKAHFLDKDFSISLNTIFLGGSSYQLWFLPAIFIWQIFVFMLVKIGLSFNYKILLFIILTLAGFIGGIYTYNTEILQAGFTSLFFYYLGYVFVTPLIYLLIKNKKINPFLFFVIALFSFISALIIDFIGFTIVFNISVFMTFLNLKGNSNPLIIKLSILSFGIYLTHALFVEGFQFLALMLKLDISSFSLTLINIILSFVFAAVLSQLLLKIKFLKWTII